MFQLIISHTVNGDLGLGTFHPFMGSITNSETQNMTKCHSSVQHVSFEIRELGLVSVRYNFLG